MDQNQVLADQSKPPYQPEQNLQPYNTFDAGFETPVVFGAFDPSTSQSKTVVYKTRFNEDGTNVTMDYPKDMSIQDIQSDIKNNFKKDAADVQVLLMMNGMPNDDGSPKTKDQKYIPTKEEYELLKPVKNLFDPPSPGFMETAYHGLKDIAKSVWSLTKTLASGYYNEISGYSGNPESARKQLDSVVSILDGASTSIQRTKDLGSLILETAEKGIASISGDKKSSDNVEYDAFVRGLKSQMNMDARFSGQELSIQQLLDIDPNSRAGIEMSKIAAGVSPEQRKDIESIAGAFDLAAFAGVGEILGLAGKISGVSGAVSRIGENAVFKYISPSYLSTQGAKLGLAASRLGGSAIEKTMRAVYNSVNSLVEGIEAGSVTPFARDVAKYAAYGAGIYNAAPIITAGIGGKTLSLIGELGGAALDAVSSSGSVRKALVDLADNSAKSGFVKASARLAAKVAPPDYAFNALKTTMDAAINGGVFVGGLGAMQSYTTGDDPINGFRDGFAYGFGMTLPIGAAASLLGKPVFDKAKAAKYFQEDIAGRPETVKLQANNENGLRVDIEFNDLEARADLFRRSDLGPDGSTSVLAMAKAVETAGGMSIFHNENPAIVSQLLDAGIPHHNGVQFINGPEGRPVVIFNVKSIGKADAIHEVLHAKFSDELGRFSANALIKGLESSGGLKSFEQEIKSFADKYIGAIESSAKGDQATMDHANKLREIVDSAFDVNTAPESRQQLISDLMNEYTAHYVGAALSGFKPEQLVDGRLRNIWDKVIDKVKSNALSVLDFSKQGLRYDPVYGHFFNEKGQRTIIPEMEKVVNLFSESLKEGRKQVIPEQTNDGSTYFDVKSDKPFISPEDLVEGRQSTKSEKKKILSDWFYQNRSAFASTDPNAELLISSEVKYRGDVHGNITKMKDGTPILFTRTLSDATIGHLSNQVVNGVKVYDSESLSAISSLSQASARGHIIYIDAWHDIGRHSGDRSNVYYGRANRPVLPLGFQQTPTGGLEGIMLDVGRSWHRVKRFAESVPSVSKSMRDAGIDTLGDYIKVLQRYFDNYSSPNPKPAAELPGFSEPLRDAIAQSLNIGIRDAFKQLDAGNVANQHTFEGKMIPEQGDVLVDIGGQQVKMKRDSQALMSIRLDRMLGTSEFRVDGSPVAIKYTSDVPNRVRANFSAKTTVSERLGETEVKTDKESGARMFTGRDGATKLFLSAAEPPKDFKSQLDAETYANKRKLDIERAMEDARSPEAVQKRSQADRVREADYIIGLNKGTKLDILSDTTKSGKDLAKREYNSIKKNPVVNIASSISQQFSGFLKRNTGIQLENQRAVPSVNATDFIDGTFLRKVIDTYPEAESWIELGAINKSIMEANSNGKRSFEAWSYSNDSLSSINPRSPKSDPKLPPVGIDALLKRRSELLDSIKLNSDRVHGQNQIDRIASDSYLQAFRISQKSIEDRSATSINRLFIKAYEGKNGISPVKQQFFNLAAAKGNKFGDSGFSNDPLIEFILENGGIVSPKTLRQKYKNNPQGLSNALSLYDYVTEKGGLSLSSPTHQKIWAKPGEGLSPDEVINFLNKRREGEQGIEMSISSADELWSAIESASHTAVKTAKESRRIERLGSVFNDLLSDSERSGFTKYNISNSEGSVIYTRPLKGNQYAIVIGKTFDPLSTSNREINRRIKAGEIDIDSPVVEISVYEGSPENSNPIYKDYLSDVSQGIWVKSDSAKTNAQESGKRVLSESDAKAQEAEFMSRHSGNVSGKQSIEAFNNIINNPRSSVAKIADSVVDMYKESAITLDVQNRALEALHGKESTSVNRDVFVDQAKAIIRNSIASEPMPENPVLENAKQEMNSVPVQYANVPVGRSNGKPISDARRLAMLKMATIENAVLLRDGKPGLDMDMIRAIADDGEASGITQFLTDKIVERNITEKVGKKPAPQREIVPLPSDVAKVKVKQEPKYTGPALTSYAEELLAKRGLIQPPKAEAPKAEPVSTQSSQGESVKTQAFLDLVAESNPLVTQEVKQQRRARAAKTEQQKVSELLGKMEAKQVADRYRDIQKAGHLIEADVRRSVARESEGAKMEARARSERTAARKEDFTYALKQRALEVLRRKKLEERMKGFAELLNERDAARAIEFEAKQKMMRDAEVYWQKKINEWVSGKKDGQKKQDVQVEDVDFDYNGVRVSSDDLPKKVKFILGFNGKIRVVLPSGNVILASEIDEAVKRAQTRTKEKSLTN